MTPEPSLISILALLKEQAQLGSTRENQRHRSFTSPAIIDSDIFKAWILQEQLPQTPWVSSR